MRAGRALGSFLAERLEDVLRGVTCGRTEHVTEPAQRAAADRAALQQILAGQDVMRKDQLRFDDDVIDADGHTARLPALFVGLAGPRDPAPSAPDAHPGSRR